VSGMNTAALSPQMMSLAMSTACCGCNYSLSSVRATLEGLHLRGDMTAASSAPP
jgi:hypothetical protein